jgi:hypothetical protein
LQVKKMQISNSIFNNKEEGFEDDSEFEPEEENVDEDL